MKNFREAIKFRIIELERQLAQLIREENVEGAD